MAGFQTERRRRALLCRLALACATALSGCKDDAGASAGPPPPSPTGPADYATWPIPNAPGSGLPNSMAYAVEGDSARDTVTGLVWLREASATGAAFDQAPAYCESRARATGQPWRLPTRIELVSIADPSRRAPALDPVAFPDTPVDFFWTASPVSGDARLGWAVFFLDGAAVHADRLLVAKVRCVRGPATATGGVHFEREGEIVRDPTTRLSWHLGVVRRVTQPQAKSHCGALGDGWRVPSLAELQALVHVGRSEPSIDPDVFPRVPAETFWTSTPIVSYAGYYWGVSFATGQPNYNVEGSLLDAVCVR